jgi:peptide/nickel transport system permease protein
LVGTASDSVVSGATPVRMQRTSSKKARIHQPGSAKMVAGVSILGLFVLLAVVGPMVAPDNPSTIGPEVLAAPSATHLLGTTQTGQDVLSQLLIGTRSTLLVGFVAGTIATALSVVFGVSAGYFGGFAGERLSMLSNIFLVIPALPLLVVLASFLPQSGSLVVAAVIAVTGWAWGARVLRAQTLSIRQLDYVQAAKSVGERSGRIILCEILPNELAIVASSFLFTVLFAIFTDAGLTFLGVGNTTTWSWGAMLYWAQNDEALSAGGWWWFVPPSSCIALAGTGLALANFGIDEIINPRLRSLHMSREDRRWERNNQGLTPVGPGRLCNELTSGGRAVGGYLLGQWRPVTRVQHRHRDRVPVDVEA